MIPLRDNVPSRRFPATTLLLIFINVLVYLFEVTLGQQALSQFIRIYGVTPYYFTTGIWPYARFLPLSLTLITTQFLHGGLLHLGGNMLFLWIFGDNVEDQLGSVRYLLLYLGSGVIGSIAHIWLEPLSRAPLVGASGAIAGVLGAYLMMFPWAKVKTLVLLGWFLTTVNVPAILFLGFWFLVQLWSGSQMSLGAARDAVAYWTHVGGFASGFFLVRLMKPRRLYR
ncbi:MAG: rhomboid family intramembrane serine protease [Bacillota bacterium]